MNRGFEFVYPAKTFCKLMQWEISKKIAIFTHFKRNNKNNLSKIF